MLTGTALLLHDKHIKLNRLAIYYTEIPLFSEKNCRNNLWHFHYSSGPLLSSRSRLIKQIIVVVRYHEQKQFLTQSHACSAILVQNLWPTVHVSKKPPTKTNIKISFTSTHRVIFSACFSVFLRMPVWNFSP